MYYYTGYNDLYGEDNRKFKDIFIDKYNKRYDIEKKEELLAECDIILTKKKKICSLNSMKFFLQKNLFPHTNP